MSDLTYLCLVQKLGEEIEYRGKEGERAIDGEGDGGNFTLKSRENFPAMVGRQRPRREGVVCACLEAWKTVHTALLWRLSGPALPRPCLSGQDSPFLV